MPSQGPNSGSSFTTSGTPAWSNPTNAQSSDNQYATVTLSAAQTSGSLLATGFGFSVPSSATITGVVVEVEGYASEAGASWRLYLLVGGSRTGNLKQAPIPSTESYVTFGSSTDLWGTTLTPTQVNGTGFGTEVIALAPPGWGATISLDHVRITVYYELEGGFFYQSVII